MSKSDSVKLHPLQRKLLNEAPRFKAWPCGMLHKANKSAWMIRWLVNTCLEWRGQSGDRG